MTSIKFRQVVSTGLKNSSDIKNLKTGWVDLGSRDYERLLGGVKWVPHFLE